VTTKTTPVRSRESLTNMPRQSRSRKPAAGHDRPNLPKCAVATSHSTEIVTTSRWLLFTPSELQLEFPLLVERAAMAGET